MTWPFLSGHIASARGVQGAHSEAIDRLFVDYDKAGSPGLNLAVFQGDEIIHRRGYGVASIEHDIPFSEHTVLRLGSTTKHMCATALLCLENDGTLRLDDDVRRFAPELPDYGGTLTLRMLANMTSGLPDGFNVALFCGLDTHSPLSRQQIFTMQRRLQTSMFAPGTRWSYSNTNYNILSLVIERASGKTLEEFMRERLFAPLGMHDTRLTSWETEVIPHKATGYSRSTDGFQIARMAVETCGDGGVDSTIADMATWYRNYRSGALFDPDYRARIEGDATLTNGERTGYGLGVVASVYRGRARVGHSGGMPGFLCDFAYYPDDDFGVILFANVLDRPLLQAADRVADIIVFKENARPLSFGPLPGTARSGDAPEGVYADASSGEVVELRSQDDKLLLYRFGEGVPLLHGEDNRFALAKKDAATAQSISFRSAEHCTLRLLGRTPISLHKVAVENVAPDVADALAGCYHSSELGEYFHVLRDADGAYVQGANTCRPLLWRRLKQVAPDLFVCLVDGEPSVTNVVVRVERENGRVQACLFSLNRVFNLRFDRIEYAPPAPETSR